MFSKPNESASNEIIREMNIVVNWNRHLSLIISNPRFSLKGILKVWIELMLKNELNKLMLYIVWGYNLMDFFLNMTVKARVAMVTPITGSFNNDDGDGSENVKKAISLLSKTTTLHELHVHHAFLYLSLPPLQDYNVKMPNFTFYGGHKQATTNFSFSF